MRFLSSHASKHSVPLPFLLCSTVLLLSLAALTLLCLALLLVRHPCLACFVDTVAQVLLALVLLRCVHHLQTAYLACGAATLPSLCSCLCPWCVSWCCSVVMTLVSYDVELECHA